ncbi:glycosyltransferase family 2 protein [Paracoccus sp. (in: a-proteobacteria)]|uniref:glycosyltransferase family 2 protein n=1 Tax=Paracoccus sp. TaxID=267 RepID=UPI00396C4202
MNMAYDGHQASSTRQELPLISVVMANFRGGRHLEAAMRSVLAQTWPRLELILADDASDDNSLAIADAVAATDDRVRVLRADRNQGPAITRNRALDSAQGDWIAIVDSDDLIHPSRLERLVAAAYESGAGIVADDLVYFGAAEARGGRTLLQSLSLTGPMTLEPALYLRANAGDSRIPGFGYLKPLISRSTLQHHRYDPNLQIGEDYDLILRLLLEGAQFVLLPDPLYAYRRHASSISYRMTVERQAAMLAAHRALPPMPDAAARRAAGDVDRHLRRALRYEELVRDLKDRRLAALPRLADPAMLRRLAASLNDRRRRKAAQEAVSELPLGAVSCVELPRPGQFWSQSPAAAAAAIAAEASLGRNALPSAAPEWARWLDKAVRDSVQA